MLDRLFKIIEKITPQKWRWILNHEGFKRYFANTGWMFFGQMFSLLVAFFIGAWLARYLGPENYGVLNYALAFAGIFAFISSLGVDGILSRELVKFPEKRDLLLGTTFRLKIIGGSIAFVLAVISAGIFQSSPLIKLLIILFSFSFILQSINVVSIYFQAEVKSKNNVKASLFATLISSLLKVAVIMLDKGVIWLMVVYALDALWQGIGFYYSYTHNGLSMGKWSFNRSTAKEILRSSWPLMFSSLAVFVYMKIDQVMIGNILNNKAVGLYSVAIKLAEIWYFIPGIICGSLFPAIIKAEQKDKKLFKQKLLYMYLLMFAISFTIALFITLFAKEIIYFIFGSDYFLSVSVLKIYIWAGIGVFLGGASTQYLIIKNLNISILLVTVSGALINVVLNLVLIKKYGINGAAVASLVAYLFVPIANILIQEKEINKSAV